MLLTNGHKHAKIDSYAQWTAASFGHLHRYKIQMLDTLKSSDIFIKLSEPNCRCNYSHKNQRLKKIYTYINMLLQ
jgi:hypothetical protein